MATPPSLFAVLVFFTLFNPRAEAKDEPAPQPSEDKLYGEDIPTREDPSPYGKIKQILAPHLQEYLAHPTEAKRKEIDGEIRGLRVGGKLLPGLTEEEMKLLEQSVKKAYSDVAKAKENKPAIAPASDDAKRDQADVQPAGAAGAEPLGASPGPSAAEENRKTAEEKLGRDNAAHAGSAQKSMSDAGGVANAFNAASAHPEEPQAGSVAKAKPAGGGFEPGGKGSGDPSHPQNQQDLLLAADHYHDAFQKAGLKVQGDKIVGNDGHPASTSDLSHLAGSIQGEPSGLALDRDYLDPDKGIARANHEGLRRAYTAGSAGEDFKDIRLDSDRDFKWSRSCSPPDKGCNRFADASYRKGDDVPARNLKNIWADIGKYLTKASANNGAKNAASRRLSADGQHAEVTVDRVRGFMTSRGGASKRFSDKRNFVWSSARAVARSSERAQSGVQSGGKTGSEPGQLDSEFPIEQAPAPHANTLVIMIVGLGLCLLSVPLMSRFQKK